MYNKVILVGNLTRDIELRYSQGGMGIANTAIATSRKFTSNGEKKVSATAELSAATKLSKASCSTVSS